jgi:ATP-dependent Lon protease
MTEPELILTLPVLPLKNGVLFPSTLMLLTIGRPASVAAVEAALVHEDKDLVVVAQRDAAVDTPGAHDCFSIGTSAVIKRLTRRPEGTLEVLVQGRERSVLVTVEQTEPYCRAQVKLAPLPCST